MEAVWMSICRWTDKGNAEHAQNKTLLTAKKNKMSFTRKYMELEIFNSYKITQTPFLLKNF